jgi:hypothetical protein
MSANMTANRYNINSPDRELSDDDGKIIGFEEIYESSLNSETCRIYSSDDDDDYDDDVDPDDLGEEEEKL